MLLYEMLTLRLPYEQFDTAADIITAVLDGEEVESMKICGELKQNYYALVELYQQCTNLQADERPSLNEVVSRLTQMLKGQASISMAVERRPSLVEQLIRYNNASTVRMKDQLCDFPILESPRTEIMGSSNNENLKITFHGPQTANPERFRAQSDASDLSDCSSVSFDEPSTTSHKSHKEKKKKSRDRTLSKRVSTRIKLEHVVVADTPPALATGAMSAPAPVLSADPPAIPVKRPKRNIVGKSTVERTITGP